MTRETHSAQVDQKTKGNGSGPKTVVVIPAYNEERFIGTVVLQARQYAAVVIVVDDGSTDATADVATAAGATVIRQTPNQGKGTALGHGFRRALELQPDVVITLDADGQHLFREIGKVAGPVVAGDADVVRGIGPQEHLRAFSANAAQTIAFNANGFCPATQLEEISRRWNLETCEVALAARRLLDSSNSSTGSPGDNQTPAASIIVPAYNEEEALPHVLSELIPIATEYDYEIVVVDDGSDDRTSTVASDYPCRLVSHTVNQGKGAAMQTGIEYATGKALIFIDGDATYPVEVIPEMVQKLEDFDVVRGMRHYSQENMPRVNALGNWLFESVIRVIHHVDSSDALTGLYGVRRSALQQMRLRSNGFDIESEIVIKAGAMGLRTTTIPITYHERIGAKKLRPMQDGIQILARVIALAAMYNPFMMYVVPGLVLWFMAVIAILFLSQGPVTTPFANLSVHSFILSIMGFLAGFQLIVFGLVVNLYAAETGLGVPSRSLSVVARKIPRLLGAALSFALILAGITWSAALGVRWWLSGFGAFLDTEVLVISLALVIWGVQLLCTMFFFSLFAGESKLSV